MLETRALLSTLVLESEPNGRARQADEVSFDPADNAADLTGAISNVSDRDFFHFAAPAAGVASLDVAGAGGFVGKVTVEDGAGNKLFETEPNDGVNSGRFAIQAGQDVFVRVRGQSNSTGGYTVHLALSANQAVASSTSSREIELGDDRGRRGGSAGHGELEPGDDHGRRRGGGRRGEPEPGDDRGGIPLADVNSRTGNVVNESEPNDRKEHANAFDLGADGLAQLQGTSNSDRDKDFFVFTPQTSGALSIAVQSVAGATAKLQIEDRQGNKVFETEPNDGVNAGVAQVTAGTTYFVRLRSPNKAPAAYLVDLALA
jgi:hypothetical protein